MITKSPKLTFLGVPQGGWGERSGMGQEYDKPRALALNTNSKETPKISVILIKIF